MIDLHEVVDEDDQTWREKILYSLYRKIIEFKRSRDATSVVKSQGTLAYAKSFKNLSIDALKSVKWVPPYYDDGALHESLNATHRKLTFEDEASRKKRAALNTLAFSFIGTSFALGSLMRATGQKVDGKPSFLLDLGSFIVVNFTGFVVLFAISLAVILAYPASEWGWMRNVIRGIQSASKLIAVSALFLVSVLFLEIALYLFFSIYN